MKTTRTSVSQISLADASESPRPTGTSVPRGHLPKSRSRRFLKGVASLLLGGVALALSSGAFANTFYVATNGWDGNPGSVSAPMQSLHQAIYSAHSGDTILVAPGTYSGPNNTGLNFAGKNLLLMSQQGPQSCIIDGGGTNMAFIFQDGEMGGAGVVGFTIQNTYNNGSTWSEGGAMLIEGASPTIENCIFKSCTVDNIDGGGAIYISTGSPLISYCMFENCSANGSHAEGGAIHSLGSANTIIQACTFHGNTSPWGGGAIYCQGGNTMQISQCAFRENSSDCGGGLYVYGVPNVSVTRSSFLGNTAASDGGAIFDQQQGALTIASSSFVSNHSQMGGALYNAYNQATLTNCSLVDNIGVNEASGIGAYEDSVTLTNCIVYGNHRTARPTPDQIDNNNASITVNYSDVEGGYAGTGNINIDPQFVLNPGAANVLYGDLHLQATSPCLDRGTASNVTLPYADLDNNARLYGTAPDMGAYERQPNSPFNPSAHYVLYNVSNGLVLQGQTGAGGQVMQAASSGSALQQWIITPVSGQPGCYQIMNRATGLVLESWGLGGGDGNPIDNWYANGGSNQIWSLSFQGNDFYKLINLNTGLLLEDPNSSTAAGTLLDEWSDIGGANLDQQWAIVQVP